MLAVTDITKTYTRSGVFGMSRQQTHAVAGVSFKLEPGQTFGLIGESGSGKSTLARIALRLIDPSSGTVLFKGQDITHNSGHQLKAFRRAVQPVFQSTAGALDPRMRIDTILSEPLVATGGIAKSEQTDRVAAALRAVELPSDMARRYPRTLSGGQRQRIGIARALIGNPEILILDEPVSALDVSVQAQILNLLKDLQEQRGLAFLFIGHDLAVARFISDEIAVLKHGKVIEQGKTDQVIEAPVEAYTKALVDASRTNFG